MISCLCHNQIRIRRKSIRIQQSTFQLEKIQISTNIQFVEV